MAGSQNRLESQTGAGKSDLRKVRLVQLWREVRIGWIIRMWRKVRLGYKVRLGWKCQTCGHRVVSIVRVIRPQGYKGYSSYSGYTVAMFIEVFNIIEFLRL